MGYYMTMIFMKSFTFSVHTFSGGKNKENGARLFALEGYLHQRHGSVNL